MNRRKHVGHSLKPELSLPAFVFHTASAYASYLLYFASDVMQSPAMIERRFVMEIAIMPSTRVLKTYTYWILIWLL